jgi:acetyltransferase-like isoleucine patch superfamily enzyme
MMFNQKNVTISPKTTIGKNVRIGDNTMILDNVIIEDNTTIAHNCVIGEPLHEYYSNPDYNNPVTIIGANSLIRSHTIIYAGNHLGENVSTGHHVILRGNNIIGHHTVIGTLSEIQGDVSIGHYCRIYSNVHIASLTTIGNFVFLYPYVLITNDANPPSNDLMGATIDDYTVVAVHCTIFSSVKVGKICLIGADSVVNTDFPDYSFIRGNPAKFIIDVREYAILGKGRLYPWMYRFSRGMPWEDTGYEEWINNQNKKGNKTE